jgi:hypothetical protein
MHDIPEMTIPSKPAHYRPEGSLDIPAHVCRITESVGQDLDKGRGSLSNDPEEEGLKMLLFIRAHGGTASYV